MSKRDLKILFFVITAPFAALGFIKYNGMTAEKIAKAWIRSEILMPKKILFGGTNKLIGQEDKRK